MSFNRTNILIDKGTYVKYRLKKTLLGVILQKYIPTKLQQHKRLLYNGVLISTH